MAHVSACLFFSLQYVQMTEQRRSLLYLYSSFGAMTHSKVSILWSHPSALLHCRLLCSDCLLFLGEIR